MELKVWVEGIQRIVCGVSDGTTCQDVVYALAHATGKTGRFTLVEKWRNNERLLPPQEHPLKVLSKWGEYANDVQLVLRRTSLDSKPSALQAENVPTTKAIPGDGQTSINWQKSNSLLSPTSTGRDLKKSLTFSAGGTLAAGEGNVGGSSKEKIIKDMKEASRIVSNRNNNLNNPQLLKKESNEKKQLFFTKSNDEITKDSINQISNKCIPERESILPISRFAVGPNTRNYNTNYASKTLSAKQQLATSRTSIKNLDDCSARSSESLHSKSFGSDPTSPISDHQNNSDNGMSRISMVPPQSNSSRITSQEVAGLTNSNKPPSLIPVRRIETSSRNVQDENVRRTNYPVPVHVGAIKTTRRNLGDTKKIDIEDGTREDAVMGNNQQEKVIYDHCYRDLVRLINLQREKISQQQVGLTQCDAEIMFWEEKQKDHQRQIEKIEREMEKMESSGRDLNEEVNQLDLLHLDDELDVGRQQEKMLQSELTLLRSKLSNCETELLQCKNKIRLLMDDITEDRRWKSKEEEERRHRERIVLSEIDDLQGELQQIVKDYDSKMKSCDKLEGEVKHLESAISIKKKQVEGLVQEMKAANLESLALTPAEEIRNLLEGGVHKGPGSSRKIVGSPRQLENAVPTSKNPHGVWV